MTALAVRYTGLDPDGRWVLGRPDTIADIEQAAHDMFDQGWQRLEVTERADPTHVLAWIGLDRPVTEGGKRTWQVT